MSHNLRALGLACVVTLVLGAIGAQGASAVVEHSFRSDAANEKTVATVPMEGSHVFKTTTNGGQIVCSEATFSGTYPNNILDTVTLHPKFSSCTTFGQPATVSTAGCNFIFDSDTTTGGHFSGEHATVSLECESSHDIFVDGPGCDVTFQDKHSITAVNQSLHGVTYTTLSSGDSHSSKSAITANVTVGNIKYNTIGGLACVAIGHPQGTYTGGIYEGKASATGYEDPGDSATQRTGSTTNGTIWHHSKQVNISLSTPT